MERKRCVLSPGELCEVQITEKHSHVYPGAGRAFPLFFSVATGLMGKRKQLQFMLCRADSCGSLALPHTSEFIKGAAHRKEPLPPSLGIHEFGARKLEVELILEEAKLQITWFHVLFCLSPPLHHKIRTNQLCKMMFWEVG